jgi:hypothetical protein
VGGGKGMTGAAIFTAALALAGAGKVYVGLARGPSAAPIPN